MCFGFPITIPSSCWIFHKSLSGVTAQRSQQTWMCGKLRINRCAKKHWTNQIRTKKKRTDPTHTCDAIRIVSPSTMCQWLLAAKWKNLKRNVVHAKYMSTTTAAPSPPSHGFNRHSIVSIFATRIFCSFFCSRVSYFFGFERAYTGACAHNDSSAPKQRKSRAKSEFLH